MRRKNRLTRALARTRGATRGSTMVTVIVAFAIIMLLFAMFTQVLGLANRTIERAYDLRSDAQDFIAQYYTGRTTQNYVIFGLQLESGGETIQFRTGILQDSSTDNSMEMFSFGF